MKHHSALQGHWERRLLGPGVPGVGPRAAPALLRGWPLPVVVAAGTQVSRGERWPDRRPISRLRSPPAPPQPFSWPRPATLPRSPSPSCSHTPPFPRPAHPPHRPPTLSGRSRPPRSPTWAWSALNKMKKVGETGQDVWTLSKSFPTTCGTGCHPRGLRAVQGHQREGRSGGKRPSSPAFEGAVCSERASDFSHFAPSRT